MTSTPAHDLGRAELAQAPAVWLSPGLIAWPWRAGLRGHDVAGLELVLHAAAAGGVDVRADAPRWRTWRLATLPDGVPAAWSARHPHLSDAFVAALPDELAGDPARLRDLLRGQIAVAAHGRDGAVVAAGGVQTAGVLDALYPGAVDAPLGPVWRDGVPTLGVWAPTAQRVDLLLWRRPAGTDTEPTRVPMRRGDDGAWSVTGQPSWRHARYRFAATVYAPTLDQVVENHVTDPYAVALTTNSTHAVLADLDAPELRPRVWAQTPSPALEHLVDQASYELHVRDFSRDDATCPADDRGTYLGFTHDTRGTRHLARLAAAGLTTVQLLPTADQARVEEDRAHQQHPDADLLAAAAPDSDLAADLVQSRRPAFNWGYDPWHVFAPEGGFATAEGVDGPGRTAEVRAMVGALHGLGLRVVLDVVFNHTFAAGQDAASVLDRLVPGYYHRRDDDGAVAVSTCCPGVATEAAMGRRLMVDACVHWVRAYRVDGFRLDLMGHHDKASVLAVRAALDALTPEADGVDGRGVTLWGEGWNFGEVADNARFVQATQGQLGGTGIGTFSDRLRDAVRGGGALDADPRAQGFGTGLVSAPNGAALNGDAAARVALLAQLTDVVQVGLAGHLSAFTFVSAATGTPVRGDEVRHHGRPAGYADEPDEAVAYVDAHDNETLFDALALKLPPGVPMDDRVRINTVCLALVTFGQGPLMWHAGADFLRSKSGDRNSYDSGDWFNRLDFSLRDNGFGAGLPPARDNLAAWPVLRPLLADPALKPGPDHLARAHDAALDLLRVRASSRLFRLGRADAVRARLSFPVSGTRAQRPGVVVMLLDDRVGDPVDDRWAAILVAVNATAGPVTQPVPQASGEPWVLHPVLAAGSDAVTRASGCHDGVLTLPAWTAAVFVLARP